MKVSQRLKLIDKIGRELQARYSYSDIDAFLQGFGIEPSNTTMGYNSKWLYSKEAIKSIDNAKIIAIAQELEIDLVSPEIKGVMPPDIWDGGKEFRLFLSHLAIHKDKANRLKGTLAQYHISAFVAHEDIHPTREWQNEIEKALHTMDAMLAIHTKGFSQSIWTQQEIGFALGRGVKILSLRLEEDPQGFISKHQAILRRGRNAEGIAEEINTILLNDTFTKSKMAEVRSAHQKIEDDEIPF
jgi:signal recognition particle subunit SEC65